MRRGSAVHGRLKMSGGGMCEEVRCTEILKIMCGGAERHGGMGSSGIVLTTWCCEKIDTD